VEELTRSFIAIEVSEGARAQIGELLKDLRQEPGIAVRWVEPRLVHLTLVFLGEVTQGFLVSARLRLADAAKRHPRFALQLKGLGAFPHPRRARVVWVGTEEGREEACLLQADVAASLRSIGFQLEKRPFSPHLTIGRLRVPGDVSRVVTAHFESERFGIARVVLFRSVLGPKGPSYTSLAEFPLADQQATA